MTPTRAPLASASIRADAAQSQRAEVSPIASATDLEHVECIDYRGHQHWHFRDHTAPGHPWRCGICQPFGVEPGQ